MSKSAPFVNRNFIFLYCQFSKLIWILLFARETFHAFHVNTDDNCWGTSVRAHYLHFNLSSSNSGMHFSKSIISKQCIDYRHNHHFSEWECFLIDHASGTYQIFIVMQHEEDLYQIFLGLGVLEIRKSKITKPKEIHCLEMKLLDTTEGTGSLNKQFYITIIESQTGLEQLGKKA